ncbi:MAG: SLBB domain-containing protein, partial [Planctomycetota bacterium]|jgi:protein involved in polysaccharide export with SLBB domain
LYVAGGPSVKGSYRRIRVVRGEKTVAEVDLYDFLRAGRRKGDVRLLAGDTVFVPLAGTRVTVAGKVRRPAVYETRDEKSLAQVLALAGGIEPGGFSGVIRIERREGDGLSLLDVKADPASVAVLDGDTVKVFPLYPDPLERVEVSGAVERPGRYQWAGGMKVSDLLTLAGKLLPDAYTAYAEIRRKVVPEAGGAVEAGGRRFHPQWKLVRVDLAGVLRKEGEADLPLEALDRLHVLSLAEVNPKLTVEILGAVEKPGVVEYAEGMHLLDLLHREGQGLSPDAHLGRAEIVRRTAEGRGYVWAQGTEQTAARTETIAVDLRKALAGDPEANPPLLPFDVIKIYRAEEVRPAPTVTVLGAVGSPGSFELSSSMRVSDLVFRAGNITAEAYLDHAEILRRTYDASAPATYRLETLSLDLGKALQGDKKHDRLLENFDRLIVRRTSDYYVEVEVKGEVRFPGVYLMPKGSKLTDLIARAGGYTQDAYLAGAFFTREELRRIQEQAKERFITDQKAKMIELEGQAQAMASDVQAQARIRESVRTRRRLLDELAGIHAAGRLAIRLDRGLEFADSPHNLVLRHGDGLSIPETPVSVTVQGEVFAPGSVLHTEGKRIEYYVNQVGGMKEDADEDRMYLVKADGRAYSRSAKGAFAVRWDANNLRWVRNRLGRVVDPGDVIMVPPKRIVVSGSDLTKDVVDILYKIALSAGVLAGIAG